MKPARSTTHDRKEAFTLVELSIVLAVIVLLGLMVLPVLARTKGDSRGFQCLSNNRELNRAWRMWTDDNNDLLLYAARTEIYNSPPDNSRVWLLPESLQFSANQTNLDGSVSIRQSPLWPYCGRNASIWHCPSDEATVLVNNTPKPRAYNYAMNYYLGGAGGIDSINPLPSPYVIYLKCSDIINPRPERSFVFLDVRSDSF